MDSTGLGRNLKSESTTKPKGYPGMWQFPKNPDKCCIYRVNASLRRVNAEAYTPQLVIIGPLHHHLKSQALRSLGDITNTKSMGYLNLEEHKTIYLAKSAEKLDGNETIDGFRRTIKKHEERIRESYSESTTWIESSDYFSHFTDLARCVRVESLQSPAQREYKTLENGCLKMPRLLIDDSSETILRNVMALEQCHYPYTAHVSSYVDFLDYLIDTDKDVDLLVEKGIIKNWIGQPSSVANMVNKLGFGIASDAGSCYYDVAVKLNDHYSNPLTRSLAFLKRVYFGNIWHGTATVAATLLLLMTLAQTVASLYQLLQDKYERPSQ